MLRDYEVVYATRQMGHSVVSSLHVAQMLWPFAQIITGGVKKSMHTGHSRASLNFGFQVISS